MATLGGRLAELRREKDFSQAELANRLKLGQSTIAMYESDKRQPDPATLQRLADFFQVTTDYLLGRSDTPNPSAKLPAWISQLPDDIREFFEKNPDKVGVYFRITKKAAESMDPEVLEAFIETFRDVRRRYKEDTGEDLD